MDVAGHSSEVSWIGYTISLLTRIFKGAEDSVTITPVVLEDSDEPTSKSLVMALKSLIEPITEDNSSMNESNGGNNSIAPVQNHGGDSYQKRVNALLAPKGVWLIVFNREKMLSDLRDKIKSWVDTLTFKNLWLDDAENTDRISIVLVGTYKNNYALSDAENISESLEGFLRRNSVWRYLLKYKREDGKRLCFFPVDCTQVQDHPTMKNLKDALQEKIERQKKGKMVSLSLGEAFALADKYGVENPLREVMLRFFYDHSMPKTWLEKPELKGIAFLEPVKYFVRRTGPDTAYTDAADYEKYFVIQAWEKLFVSDFDDMVKKRIIKAKYVKEILIKQAVMEKHHNEINRAEDLYSHFQIPKTDLEAYTEKVTKFLIDYGLMIPFDDHKNPTEYLVPSLLPHCHPDDIATHNDKTVYFYFSLDHECEISTSKSDMMNKGFLIPNIFKSFIAQVRIRLKTFNNTPGYCDQMELTIGSHDYTFTEMLSLNCIRVICGGERLHGLIKLFEVILHSILEGKKLNERPQLFTMVPYENNEEYFIHLDKLEKEQHSFSVGGNKIKVEDVRKKYAIFMNTLEHPKDYDVFISYRWHRDYQKKVADFLYSELSLTVILEKECRILDVYLDRERNELGVNFCEKFCLAAVNTKIFMPLVTKDVLSRFKGLEASSDKDYVLAEWIIALVMKKRIVPICFGDFEDEVKFDSDPIKCEELKLKEWNMPDVYPNETWDFVVKMMESLKLNRKIDEKTNLFSNRKTVKEIVDDITNQHVHFQLNKKGFKEEFIKQCGDNVEKICHENLKKCSVETGS